MINTYASKKNHHITKERLAVQEQTVTKNRIPSQVEGISYRFKHEMHSKKFLYLVYIHVSSNTV